MKSYKVTFENKNFFITGFNGSLEVAKKYYLEKYFNFGIDSDIMVKCISVEVV